MSNTSLKIAAAGTVLCVAVAGMSCFNRALANVFYAPLVVCALLTLVISRQTPRILPPGLGIVAGAWLALLMANCLFVAKNTGGAFAHVALIAYLFAAAPVAATFLSDEKYRRWAINAIVAGLALGSVVFSFQVLFSAHPIERIKGLLGVMEYGGVLAMTLPTVFILALSFTETKRWYQAAGMFLLLAICLPTLIWNETRIAWISLCATFSLILFFYLFRLKLKFWLPLAVGTALVAGSVCYIAWNNQRMIQFRSRLASIYDLDNPSNFQRMTMWKHAWGEISQHPVAGVGVANLSRVVFDEADWRISRIDPSRNGHIHNTYLQFAAETGVPGLVFYLALFIPCLRVAARNILSPERERRVWALILLTALLAFFLQGLTDYVIRLKPVMYVFGVILALCWWKLGDSSNTPYSKQPEDDKLFAR